MIGTIGFALLAGVLSILSPCVLPLVPIVLGTAASEHRYGPVALAAGVATSFTVIGLVVARVGFAIGLDSGVFRAAAAVLLLAIGLVLLVPRLQAQLAVAAGPAGSWAEERFGGFSTTGLTGQFGVGLLLGAVWSPCVGPTLGAASVMAVRGENLGAVALTMLAFGIGTSLPLLILATVSREALMHWRERMIGAGSWLKMELVALLIVAGMLTLSGLDRIIQIALEQALPDWLLAITTRI